MKAVLILLAAVVLLGVLAMPALAGLELSVDYFWGDGEITTVPAENPEPQAKTKVALPTPEPSPIPTDDPEPTDNPGPTDDPEPTPEPSPDPSPIPPLKQRSDLKGIILGLRYPIGRFRPALEYGTGEDKGDGWKEDFQLLEMKAGYALVESPKGRLEPYLSYLTLEAGGFDVSGPMLGFDFRYPLTTRISLDGGAGFSFNPRLKKGRASFSDESLALAKLKLIYHFNERWDFGLGYRVYRFDGDTSEGHYTGVDAKYELATLGFTVKLGAKPKPEPPPAVPDPVAKSHAPQREPEPEPEPQPQPIPGLEPEPPAEPLPVIPVLEEYRLLKPIFFDFDKSTFRDDQLPRLDWNIAILKDHPDLYILVAGHADHHGSNDYNIALSRRRAQAVTDYLVVNGIDLKRITIYAYGESYPYDKYDANPDWESDRWVDILVSHLPPSWEMGIEQRGVSADLR